MISDRRQHQRRDLEEQAFVYIGGNRLDAKSADISAGGLFLETEQEMERGSLVAVVFNEQARKAPAIYLLGRVVRVKQEAPKGVGLRWEKAVTTGAPEDLARFLGQLLGRQVSEVRRVAIGPEQDWKSVYLFPDDAAPAEYEMEATAEMAVRKEPASPASSFLAYQVSEEEVKRVKIDNVEGGSAYVADGKLDFEELAEELDSGSPPGPFTARIETDVMRAPAGITGKMETMAGRLPVQISFLGARGMFITTQFIPLNRKIPVKVSFDVVSRQGTRTVTCRCKITGVDDGQSTGTPGLDLKIDTYEEGQYTGLFRQYVRWLHFRTLSHD